MSEERYTLTEVTREIARRECQMHGHDYDVVVSHGRGPVELRCLRCGESWRVERRHPE